MTRTTILALLGVLSLGTGLCAQTLNAVITPNPVPIGTPIVITVSDALGTGAQLPSGCLVTSVTQGGPAGIGVEMLGPFGCSAVITPIPSCASGNTLGGQWNPWGALGTGAAPGRYWFNITFWDAGFSQMRTESFPFTIQSTPADPTLTRLTAPLIGTTHDHQITSPGDPGAAYICATSATTNLGIPIGADRAGLDADAIFWLSFPNPLPGIFLNYQGTLNGAGASPLISINLPNDPALQCLSLHTQGVILPTGGGQPRLTNTVHTIIQ